MIHFIFLMLGFLLMLYQLIKSKTKGKQIPGPKGLPIFGCSFYLSAENTHVKYAEFAKSYGDICEVQLLKNNVILLNSSDLINAISEDKYKQYLNDRPETFYGENILFGSQSTAFYKDGYCHTHDNLRKGFARAVYAFEHGHCSSFDADLKTLIEDDLAKDIKLHAGTAFEFTSMIQKSLTRVLAFVLTGEICNDNDNGLEAIIEYTDMVNIIVTPSINNMLTLIPFLHKIPGPYASYLATILRAKHVIVQRFFIHQKESYTPGTIRGFVDFYIKQQNEDLESGKEIFFTDEKIICQILELCASVMLTTWGAIVNTFLCLVNHPEYQDKIFEELSNVACCNKSLEYGDKAKCPTLEAVEMEVHRYVTGFPLLLPRSNKHHVEFEGYNLPKDSILVGNVWFIHHDEKIWGDPWNFRPERWLNDQGYLISSDHVLRKNWLPFGRGRRRCVGEHFTRSRYLVYVTTLLRRWQFKASPGKCGSCDPRNSNQFDIKVTIRSKPFFCRAIERDT